MADVIVQNADPTTSDIPSLHPSLTNGTIWVNRGTLNAWVCQDAATGVWKQLGPSAYEGSAAPAVTDDVDGGFRPGSIWADTTNDEAYVCLDASDGAAVWHKLTNQTQTIVTHPLPLDADGVFHVCVPYACTITELRSAVSGATTTTDEAATIQAAVGTAGSFTDTTNGLLTIAGASVVGTVDTATPTANNTLAANEVIELTVTDGSQVEAATAIVTIVIEPT